MIDDVVPFRSFGQVIHGRHVQQHLEIESRIVLQRAENLLDVLSLDSDREIPAELPHADQVVRESFLECACDRAVDLLLLVQKANQARGGGGARPCTVASTSGVLSFVCRGWRS